MPTWLPPVGALVALFAGFFIWGFSRLRRNSLALARALESFRHDDAPAHAAACVDGFARQLGIALDPEDPVACARNIESTLRDDRARRAFERPDLEYAYVLHCGALLGELVVRHAGGRWQVAADGVHEVVVQRGEAELRTWPFDKVWKQRWNGDPGDLEAWMQVAIRGPEAFGDLERAG